MNLSRTMTTLAGLRTVAGSGHQLARFAEAAYVLSLASLETEVGLRGADPAWQRVLAAEIETGLAGADAGLREAAGELLRGREGLRSALAGLDYSNPRASMVLFGYAVAVYNGGDTRHEYRFALALVLLAELASVEIADARLAYKPDEYAELFNELDLTDLLELRDRLLVPHGTAASA